MTERRLMGNAGDSFPLREIPPAPLAVSGAALLVRLVDALGYRYYWATEGLRAPDMDFRPGPGSMTLRELLAHILKLSAWTDGSLGGSEGAVALEGNCPLDTLRLRTLKHLEDLRTRLLEMDDGALSILTINGESFWHVVNGPLADALTHVGQVNAWRRLAGNPCPRARVFRGLPPKEEGREASSQALNPKSEIRNKHE